MEGEHIRLDRLGRDIGTHGLATSCSALSLSSGTRRWFDRWEARGHLVSLAFRLAQRDECNPAYSRMSQQRSEPADPLARVKSAETRPMETREALRAGCLLIAVLLTGALGNSLQPSPILAFAHLVRGCCHLMACQWRSAMTLWCHPCRV